MAKTTKASPVEVSFTFDSDAFYALSAAKDGNTAALIRMVHETIRPGVTHANIAARIIADNVDETGSLKRAIDETNIAMTVSHYAQTAALALSHDPHGSVILDDDASLVALYKVRTTGNVTGRREMVAKFTGKGSDAFVTYVAAWAKDTRKAATAAKSASADKVTAKTKGDGTETAPKDDAPKALPADSMKAILASLDVIIAAEADTEKLAEFAKALQVRVNRCKATAAKATPATVAA